ncbi:MAG: Xaa-Pro peptidase family protein [Proteobacteria bacterium]|nr:aminopeptidase P family protein [Desulfobacula sp.]MBU3954716.1 Xaa-Pro peptidase family protein [Pseudomonadota bacterium]MBU4131659.1 Xaa-Pro peptidase family protein [Pseudomonadota bacterium]
MNPDLLLDITPESEIFSRIKRLKRHMEEAGIASVFLTHKPDIYYFSGTAQDCYLYVCLDRDPLLFVKRYLPRAALETPIRDIFSVASVTQIPDKIMAFCKRLPSTMGLAFDVVPVREYHFYQGLFESTVFVDGTPLIEACRQIKSSYEIGQMEKAARVSRKTFDFIGKNLSSGISEMAFCGKVEAFARTWGHSGKLWMRHYRSEGFSFHLMSGITGGLAGALDSPVCGTGTCTAYPFGAGPKLIRENEPILIDLGTMVNGYHMDESRMFVLGKMEPEASAASMAAMEILNRIQEAMKPGAGMGDIFDASVRTAAKMGYEQEYLGLPHLKSRFVGHGIGLELVENPLLAKGRTTLLQPGMVFAVEPKFVFKDRFAAGIESVILITDTGSRFLSQTQPGVFSC